MERERRKKEKTSLSHMTNKLKSRIILPSQQFTNAQKIVNIA
jgi:hypothetical protein